MHQIEEPVNHDCWHHVAVDEGLVFNKSALKWLEHHVGEHGKDWSWSYQWINVQSDTNTDWIEHCQLTVAFADTRRSTIFALAWSSKCK